jgi:RNA polymerase sigma-B factor
MSTPHGPTMTAAKHDGDASADAGVYERVEDQLAQLRQVHDDDEICGRRAQIITTCLPLADHIAYRFAGRGEPDDDLIQVARLGLVKVIDRYDPDKGRFLGYAVRTIMGEVRRHFRDNTWGMRVPRSVKETRLRMREAFDSLAQRLGRTPTARELATELGVGYEEVIQAMEVAHAYRPLSLDAALDGSDTGDQTLGAAQGAKDPRYDTVEDAMAVAAAVPELSRREPVIVRMRFCDCLSQTEIGSALGISQVHVSRLLSAALERLRVRLWSDASTVLPVVVALPLAG